MALTNLTKVQTVGIGSNIEVVGVVTTGQFKSGTSNLHSTGIELTNLNVSGIATIGGNLSVGGVLTYEDVTNIDSIGIITARSGINVSGGQLDVGSNIKIGNAGVITATSFVGSGAGLTGITQTTINTNADNRIITGSGTANTLNGEATLTFTNSGSAGQLNLKRSTSTDQEAIFYYGSSNLEIETREATGIKFKTNKGDRLSITSGGYVNIGGDYEQTSYNLSVTNTGGNLFRIKTANEGDYDLRFMIQNSESNIWHYGTDDFVFGNRYDRKLHFITNGSKRLTINGDLIGINNISPSYTLDVNGDNGGGFSATTNSTHGQLSVVGKNSAGNVSAISRIKSYPSGSGNTSDMAFETRNSSSAMVERLRITSGGVIETGSKTITGGNNLAIQNFKVKGVWSGSPSIGKEIELISGYDSSVKMAAIGYNLTDVNTGSTYGGDLVFHTQPLYSSPTTPLPERMRISSTGYVTKSVVPSWNLRPRYNSTQTTANTSSHHAIGWGANGTANSNFLQNCTLEASGFTYNIHNGQNYGKLKVPVAGRYYVNCTYRVENNPGQGNIYVYVNNSQIARQHVEMWGHRPYMHCQYASVLNLAANDTILIAVSCANANISGYNDNVNWFSGYLIG